MSMFTTRNTVTYSLPLDKTTSLLRPEGIIIDIPNTKDSIDIGSLCYLIRNNKPRKKYKGTHIVKTSLCNTRKKKIRKLIDYINEEYKHGHRSAETLISTVRNLILFINWCDINKIHNALDNEVTTRSAVVSYISELRDRLRRNEIVESSAARMQNDTIRILQDFLEIDSLQSGINLIKQAGIVNQTPVPDEEAVAKAIALCSSIFNGLTTLIIQKEKFPFKLSMPEFLKWKENHIWVFPTKKWFMSPTDIKNRALSGNGYWAYDYENGIINKYDDIKDKYSEPWTAKTILKNAANCINNANTDPYNHHRIRLGILAHNSFVLLFVANTGMNWSQVRNLLWSDDFEVGKSHQGFRDIKYRAKNKKVSFRIETRFLSVFKQYLELRKHLLNERKCNTLFFTLGENLTKPPSKIGDSVLSSLFKTLKRIDKDTESILSRSWRKNKSDWLLRETDITTTSLMLQNSEPAVKGHYSEGSEVKCADEMSSFYKELSKVVINSNSSKKNKLDENAIGRCREHGNPKPINIKTDFEPDCHQAEGCLFCNKYCIHADEKDVRKIISCRYCLKLLSNQSASNEHFNKLFAPVISRINDILTAISNKSKSNKDMIERITYEVEQEEHLDPYWSSKLDMLISIGLT